MGRERNVSWPLTCPQPGTQPTTQACAPIRNQTGDLLACETMPHPLSRTNQSQWQNFQIFHVQTHQIFALQFLPLVSCLRYCLDSWRDELLWVFVAFLCSFIQQIPTERFLHSRHCSKTLSIIKSTQLNPEEERWSLMLLRPEVQTQNTSDYVARPTAQQTLTLSGDLAMPPRTQIPGAQGVLHWTEPT